MTPTNPTTEEILASLWVSKHALERLRERYPNCGVPGARAILAESTRMDPGMVMAILRRTQGAAQDSYFLTRDKAEILVVAKTSEDFSWTYRLVTCIRLGQFQQDLLTNPPQP